MTCLYLDIGPRFVESIQLYSTLHVFTVAEEGLELLHFLCVAEVEQKSTKWKRLY